VGNWVLRGGTRREQWELPPGQSAIGRGEDALVQIDDGLVSRRHAILTVLTRGVLVDDLGSRNGVLVNGQRIQRQTALVHGDHITVGGHVFVLVDKGRSRGDTLTVNTARAPAQGSALPPPPASAAIGARAAAGATGAMTPLEVLLTGMIDALARGDESAVAFSLGHLFEALGEHERGPGAEDTTTLRRAATHALRAAATMNRHDWIDRVIELHAARPRPMHAATIDALEGALTRCGDYDRSPLREYVGALEAKAATFGTYEKFCTVRLRALA
jgi:hypothetical protein